jgi:hypothetical protein
MMQTVNFKLTDAQLKKLSKAREKGESVILRLNKSQKHPGGTPLILSEMEIKKLNDGNSHDITLSKSRIEKIGGLLPILPILAGLAALTGISTGIATTVKNAKAADSKVAANRATEELAKFRLANEQKTGSGLKYKYPK